MHGGDGGDAQGVALAATYGHPLVERGPPIHGRSLTTLSTTSATFGFAPVLRHTHTITVARPGPARISRGTRTAYATWARPER